MSHLLILGGDLLLHRSLWALAAARGWDAHVAADVVALVRLLRVHPDALLVVVPPEGPTGVAAATLLDQIAAAWAADQVPLVVIARGMDRTLRRRAFALGAADVVSWSADPREVGVRLAVALRMAGHDPAASSVAVG